MLELIVKPDILKQNATPVQLLKIDLDDKSNLLNSKSVHLGFAAEDQIQTLVASKSVSDENLLQEETKDVFLSYNHKETRLDDFSFRNIK